MVFGTKSSSKTKLFEQPLEKLFSPKTIEQYNDMIKAKEATLRSNNNHIGNNVNRTLSASSWARLSQENSATKRKRAAARLRRFTIQITKTTAETSTSTSSSPSSASSSSSPPMQSDPNAPVDASQEQLLAVLPEPIRSLLNELYQRGPSTVGIFRKSPNAKHCRELRQRLESDGQSSIEQFQVNVIASVFKVSPTTGPLLVYLLHNLVVLLLLLLLRLFLVLFNAHVHYHQKRPEITCRV